MFSKRIGNPFKLMNRSDYRNQMIKVLSNELEQQRSLMLFYIDIVKLSDVEGRFGYTIANQVIIALEKLLFTITGEVFKENARLVGVDKLWADDFVFYISFPTPLTNESIDSYGIKLKVLLEERLNERLGAYELPFIQLHIGYERIKGMELSREILV